MKVHDNIFKQKQTIILYINNNDINNEIDVFVV